MTTDDARRRLITVISRAEIDQEFRSRLQADPAAALAEHQIDQATVDEYSSAFDDIRQVMWGCNDGTCFTSDCPDTCFVTACGTTDCGETIPDGVWRQGEEFE